MKATNIRRSLLEEFIHAPINNTDDNLETLGRLVVIAQKQIAAGASLTDVQAADFASRLDDVVADAIS